MERISELLDEVGWSEQIGQKGYYGKVFRWMVEATNRIQELQHEVGELKKALRTKADQF